MLNKSCVDHDCPGFVQTSHNIGLGGRVRPVSVYNGPQYVITILIFKVFPCSINFLFLIYAVHAVHVNISTYLAYLILV
jgi:hypothetical protein